MLTEQAFVKDADMTIAQYAAKVSKETGDEIRIVGFDRISRCRRVSTDACFAFHRARSLSEPARFCNSVQ